MKYALMIKFDGQKEWSYIGKNGALTTNKDKALKRDTAALVKNLMGVGSDYDLKIVRIIREVLSE